MVKWNAQWDALALVVILLGLPMLAVTLAIIMSPTGRIVLTLAVIGLTGVWVFRRQMKRKS